MTWQLFIDDLRNPADVYTSAVPELAPQTWTVARSSEEAIKLVQKLGMPTRMSLDHDLGICSNGKGGVTTDIVPTFLRWLSNEFWDGSAMIPSYIIHSANPVGAKNMDSFMLSWYRASEMQA